MGVLNCPVAQTMSGAIAIIRVAALVVAMTLGAPSSAQIGDLDVPDVMAHAGKVFFLSFQTHQIYGDPRLRTEVFLASGDPLPSWLIFNTTRRSLIGLPLSNVQSPLLLSITSRCGSKSDSLSHTTSESDPICTPRSDVFQITVTKLSLEHSWTPQPDLANSVLHWSRDDEVSQQAPIGDYVCDGDRLIASLVLCVDVDQLLLRDRISLVANLAEFLTIPMMTILLEPSYTQSLVVIEKGFQMVSAGPGSDVPCRLDRNLEVVWPLPCSSVKHLTDFIRVLQHNVDGGRLQGELGHGVVGWYIASSDSLHTRQNRRRRAVPHQTLIPTPSIALVKPTLVQDSSHYISVAVLSTTASVSPSPTSTEVSLKSSSIRVPSAAVSHQTRSDKISDGFTLSVSSSPDASSSLPSSLADSPSYHSSTESFIQQSEFLSKQGFQLTTPALDGFPETILFMKDVEESTQQSLVSSHQPHFDTSTMGLSKITLEPTESSPISSHTFPSVGDVEFQKSSVSTSERVGVQSPLLSHHESSVADDVDISVDSLHVTSSPPTPHSVQTPYLAPAHLVQTRTVEIIAPSRIPVYDHQRSDSSGSIINLAPSQSTILDSSTDGLRIVYASDLNLHETRSGSMLVIMTPALPSSRLSVALSFSELPQTDIETHGGVTTKDPLVITESVSRYPSVITESVAKDPSVITESFDKNPSLMTEYIASEPPLITESVARDPPVMTEYVEIIYQIKGVLVGKKEGTLALFESMKTVTLSGITEPVSERSVTVTRATVEPSFISSVSHTWTEPSTPVAAQETLDPDTSSQLESKHVVSEVIRATLTLFPGMSSVFTWNSVQPPAASEFILATSDTSVDDTDYTRTSESVHDTHYTKISHVRGASSETNDDTTVITDSQVRSVGTTSGPIIPSSSTSFVASLSVTVAVLPVQASTTKALAAPPATPASKSTQTATARTSSQTTTTPKASSPITAAKSTRMVTKKSSVRFYSTPDSARTSDWSEISEDPVYNNNRPYVKNPIPQIIGERGKVFKFAIPPEVFIDVEDGNTRSLRLSLELTPTQELPTNFWLYLDPGSQVLKGLPLPEDMGNLSVNLVATDSGGLSERTTISLLINGESPRDLTHRFNMSFDVDFQQFMRNRRNITNLASRIGSYFGDSGAKYVTILNVRQGSLRLFWTNNTLSGTVCRREAIIKLYQLLNKTTDLAAHLGQHLKLSQVGYELLGACSESPATTTVTMTTLKVGSTLAPGFNIWAHVILPVMIAFLVFVLIILIIIFCNRRRRHRQAVINAEKEAISNDRNPIIFPDEMDGDDPVLQAKHPLVLPTDPQPGDQDTPQTSPKTERDEDTDGRSHDSRDQEWVDAESRRKDEHKEKPRRHSKDGHRRHRDKDGRKHSRDKDRMSGVSASSSLSFDRPNNHYLDEEEAGSRNSTLTSTKSGGSDKRHPKQPPPYWQSQSDPPPYRFPPPYLNNTTQV